jgi:hypothetical protein
MVQGDCVSKYMNTTSRDSYSAHIRLHRLHLFEHLTSTRMGFLSLPTKSKREVMTYTE